MSGKGSKRRQRRINTHDEDVEKKLEEIIEISDDNKSFTDTEKLEKDTSLKETKEEKEENGEKTITKDSLEIETVENGETTEQIPIITIAIVPPDSPKKQNGQTPDSGTTTENQTTQEENSDLEPLVLDSEDPELQFPSETGSETSEIEKSPTLTRCKTRRSQTRNLPTPKTPKALDFNGETDEKLPKKCPNELRVNVTRLEPTPEVPAVEEEATEDISVITNDVSMESSSSAKTHDTDLTNASIIVNFGDTPRNMDITTNSMTENSSSFIDSTKDKTYGETLRCLTGRKTLRTNFSTSYRHRFYNSNIELTSKDMTDSSKRYTPMQSSGTKRKLDTESPEELKKPKTDGSPGLFSYISSPFKPKRPEIPSSTPKLTSYKMNNEVETVDVELVEDPKVEPKKWCSLM